MSDIAEIYEKKCPAKIHIDKLRNNHNKLEADAEKHYITFHNKIDKLNNRLYAFLFSIIGSMLLLIAGQTIILILSMGGK